MPTGNLLWADAVTGNDSLAVRGRMTVPFKTLGAAKAAAAEGDTIMVMPGTYNERNLLKDNVNWFFLPGAKVIYTGDEDGAIFDTSYPEGTGSAIHSVVAGYGIFEHSGTGDNKRIVHSATAGSELVIQGQSISAIDTAVSMTDSNGSLQVLAIQDIYSEYGCAVVVSSASQCVIQANELRSGDYALSITGGNVEVRAQTIVSISNAAIQVEGAGAHVAIYIYEIYSTSSSTIKYNASTSPDPLLALYHARIINDLNEASSNAIGITSGGNYAIRLSNCTLIVEHASGHSISASSNPNVVFVGDSVANRSMNNVTQQGSALIANVPIT